MSTPEVPLEKKDEVVELVQVARRHIRGLDATLDKIERIKGKPAVEDPTQKK